MSEKAPVGKGNTGDVAPDQEQRDKIVSELELNMLVEAAAGTGKTSSMVDRMVELLRTGTCERIATLAAVTFTRKAASELRTRFQAKLDEETRAASGEERRRLEAALSNIDQCFIGTIHSFCARLLRERPVEADIDLAFQEIEPEEDYRLRKQAWDEYVMGLIARDPEDVAGSLRDLGMTVSELESSFMRFADFPDVEEWPVPGSELVVPPLEPAIREILKYVKHMAECEPLPDDEGKGRLVTEYRRIPGVIRRSDLSDRATAIDVTAMFDKSPPSMSQAKRSEHLDFAKAEQGEWKRICNDYAHPIMEAVYGRRYAVSMGVLEQVRDVYDRMRIQQGKLNFQDLLMKSADLLRDKPHIRAYFSARFTHLLVDEFQDTDPIQAQVMLFLTATDHHETDWRKCRPRAGSLFVVGDPKQSIYRFRRADIVTYNDVRKIIEANGTLISLSANFRASGDLIDWTNEAFEGVFPEEATAESPAFVALQKGRPAGEAGALEGVRLLPVAFDLCEDDISEGLDYEADLIARTIKDALADGKKIARLGRRGEVPPATPAEPGDFMLIVFNKDYLSVYARKLQEFGIPHQVSGGTALNEVWELKLLHTCLDAITQPDNPVALVAVLRSELFGVSDAALYAFKEAGGRFNYHTEVPEGLADEHAAGIEAAFRCLTTYSLWLQKMPPVSAVERIIADVGLMVLAAAREGGDVQAGSVAKALELLRAMQDEMPTAAELVDYLGALVDPGTKSEGFDGISALSERKSAVQVMNLHKAKGLQAPVVFLASPKTRSSDSVDAFIDRSSDTVRGYLGISVPTRYNAKLRARPVGWSRFKEIEKTFSEAEKDRLRYVAATRAESMLVVSWRDDGKGKSIWKELAGKIDAADTLPDPGEPPLAEPALEVVARDAVRDATGAVTAGFEAAVASTYSVREAKEFALSGDYEAEASGPAAPESMLSFAEAGEPVVAVVPEGEHGVEWGGAVHQVLELAMIHEDADLERFASAALAEAGVDSDRVSDLVETVKAVAASDVWRRAREAEKTLVEVPFEVSLDEGLPLPTLVRGSIDLAFLEEGGWVVVDYKTDSVPGDGDLAPVAARYAPQVRLYTRAFEECTGQKVKETALYFVRADRLITV